MTKIRVTISDLSEEESERRRELNVKKYIESMKADNLDVTLGEKTFSVRHAGRDLKFERFDNRQTYNTLLMIHENYASVPYELMEIKGQTIVDVGAYTGETAMMFAAMGARHVYSFEPHPHQFEIARRNVALNGLEDRITIVNEACGPEGDMGIPEDEKTYEMFRPARDHGRGRTVKVRPLDDIVKRYGIENGARLKMDCEGCENHAILKSSPETLATFKQIIMEYHYHSKRLLNRLEKLSFSTKYSKPQHFFNEFADKKNMYMGLIFANLMSDIVPYEDKFSVIPR